MSRGRIAVAAILATAVVVGGLVYWLQVHAYYHPARFTPGAEIVLTPLDGSAPEAIAVADLEGIDAESSPLRFRACFTTAQPLAALEARFRAMDRPGPLNGPSWFSCYDAAAVGTALERGEARAFLSIHDIHPGVDRVVAIFPDGRGYAWHQLNDEMKD